MNNLHLQIGSVIANCDYKCGKYMMKLEVLIEAHFESFVIHVRQSIL